VTAIKLVLAIPQNARVGRCSTSTANEGLIVINVSPAARALNVIAVLLVGFLLAAPHVEVFGYPQSVILFRRGPKGKD
jgi:hypothetical protein